MRPFWPISSNALEKAESPIHSRVFLVGCARSGTTLLQSLLGAHPQIATFPETHFFQRAVPGRRLARAIGLSSRYAPIQVHQFLLEAGHLNLEPLYPLRSLFLRRSTAGFIRILDAIAQEQNRSIWLEKTPGHLYHIETIEALVPEVKFIHLIRAGRDVTASLYAITREYDNAWDHPMTVDECIYWWVDAIPRSAKYVGRPGHYYVRYENLVEQTREVLVPICQFLGLEYDDEMLTRYPKVAREITGQHEPWKLGAESPINKRVARSFESVFNEEQRRYIRKRIDPVEQEINGWGIESLTFKAVR